ncbi:hypothetical protein C8R42DRAFT_648913 [Lentinula raphanica]|nr:hypothetical protein C8R42DRAFT_648913 [Lentinula raphanica]
MPSIPPVPLHPPTVIEIDTSYAPFVVGTFMNIFLYGIAVSQKMPLIWRSKMYTYYRNSKRYRDRLGFKLLVFYLFVFDTFNSFCDIGVIFEPLLLKFGKHSLFILIIRCCSMRRPLVRRDLGEWKESEVFREIEEPKPRESRTSGPPPETPP